MSDTRNWKLVDHEIYPSMMRIKGADFNVTIQMPSTLTFGDYIERKSDALIMAAGLDCFTALKAIIDDGILAHEPVLMRLATDAVDKAMGVKKDNVTKCDNCLGAGKTVETRRITHQLGSDEVEADIDCGKCSGNGFVVDGEWYE